LKPWSTLKRLNVEVKVLNHAETISNAFATYDWDAQVYGVLSVASHLAATVKNRASVLRIAYLLHGLNKKLTHFSETVHGIMEGRVPVDPNTKPATPEQLRSTADNLEHLHRTIEYVYESLRRVGLTNNSLTAGSLQSMRKHGEELVNFADWFELLSEPQQFNEIFARAEREREHGEIYDLDQVN
jgi:hypothetical protein